MNNEGKLHTDRSISWQDLIYLTIEYEENSTFNIWQNRQSFLIAGKLKESVTIIVVKELNAPYSQKVFEIFRIELFESDQKL